MGTAVDTKVGRGGSEAESEQAKAVRPIINNFQVIERRCLIKKDYNNGRNNITFRL
jgi:hypothetical protein